MVISRRRLRALAVSVLLCGMGMVFSLLFGDNKDDRDIEDTTHIRHAARATFSQEKVLVVRTSPDSSTDRMCETVQILLYHYHFTDFFLNVKIWRAKKAGGSDFRCCAQKGDRIIVHNSWNKKRTGSVGNRFGGMYVMRFRMPCSSALPA